MPAVLKSSFSKCGIGTLSLVHLFQAIRSLCREDRDAYIEFLAEASEKKAVAQSQSSS